MVCVKYVILDEPRCTAKSVMLRFTRSFFTYDRINYNIDVLKYILYYICAYLCLYFLSSLNIINGNFTQYLLREYVGNPACISHTISCVTTLEILLAFHPLYPACISPTIFCVIYNILVFDDIMTIQKFWSSNILLVEIIISRMPFGFCMK